MKIILIYDCPFKTCDKLWVYKELALKGYEVKIIDSKYVLSRLDRKGIFGKILSKFIFIKQGIKAILFSNEKDIILCWTNYSGVITHTISKILFKRRRILSLNWLNPNTKGISNIIYKNALKSKDFIATINSKDNKINTLKYYNIPDIDNIFYLPDVFDDTETFMNNRFHKTDRYCFTGGMNNRDWKTLLRVAELSTNIIFKLVALKKDWDDTLIVPQNVEVHFDTTVKEYYDLLRDAYIIVLPLKSNKASGLINIIKSIQYGIICITTNIPVTKVYYPSELYDFLAPMSSAETITKTINEIYNYSEDEYNESVAKLQNHLINNFSPRHATDIIEKIINYKNWI